MSMEHARDTVRSLYGLKKWTDRGTAIRAIDEPLLKEIDVLLGELLEMPEAQSRADMCKVLKGIKRQVSERLGYLAGRSKAAEADARRKAAFDSMVKAMRPGTVTKFEAVGSTGKPTWIMRTLPKDGYGPYRFLLLSSDMYAITQMETSLADTLELGRLYRAEVPSAFIVRYLMAAVVKDEDGEKRVLLQIPEWVLRTAADRADKYKEDKRK